MQDIIIEIMNQFGYIGIMLLIAIENVFPPIPSEVILTFGGFMTTHSSLTIIGVIIFSTIGSLIGALILYLVGRILKKERLMKLADGKLGKTLRFKREDIEKADDWFNKKGTKAVFFCRFIPIVRSLISIPAGINGMKIPKFIIYTTLGSAIWNAVLTVLGSVVGENWTKIVSIIDLYANITLIILIILFIIIMIIYYKKRVKKRDKTKNN